MAENSKIEWTDHTFNPWQGCTKVSPGCTNCYAEARDKRWHKGAHWGKGAPRLLKKDWSEPVRWNTTKYGCAPMICDCCGNLYGYPGACLHTEKLHRPRVFCASLADWLDDEVPIEWLARLLKLIHDTPNLDWLLLTKRPENFKNRLHRVNLSQPEHGFDVPLVGLVSNWIDGRAPSNVWIGTTVEDQPRTSRIADVLQIPARIRFLSVEPMLEAVEFSDVTKRSDAVSQLGKKALEGIHWVIFGGESGPGARPCFLEWIDLGMEQCRAAGVACFVKQLGANSDIVLKDKKGGDWSEWPEDLRIREFPKL